MKIKKILIILTILFITGCDVEYKLHFSEKEITEKITLMIANNEHNKETINYLDETPFYAYITPYDKSEYKKNVLNSEDKKLYEFSYSYPFESFATRFKNCYDAYSITKKGDIVSINTSKEFKCMVYNYVPINQLIINITTDYKVVEHNADEVVNNEYKWYINDKSKNNKPIKLSYNTNIKRRLSFKEFISKYKLEIIVLMSAVLLFSVITAFIIIRNKQVNKI